eukprot:8299058-Alexandrium_andersonii.AAC.1
MNPPTCVDVRASSESLHVWFALLWATSRASGFARRCQVCLLPMASGGAVSPPPCLLQCCSLPPCNLVGQAHARGHPSVCAWVLVQVPGPGLVVWAVHHSCWGRPRLCNSEWQGSFRKIALLAPVIGQVPPLLGRFRLPCVAAPGRPRPPALRAGGLLCVRVRVGAIAGAPHATATTGTWQLMHYRPLLFTWYVCFCLQCLQLHAACVQTSSAHAHARSGFKDTLGQLL